MYESSVIQIQYNYIATHFKHEITAVEGSVLKSLWRHYKLRGSHIVTDVKKNKTDLPAQIKIVGCVTISWAQNCNDCVMFSR